MANYRLQMRLSGSLNDGDDATVFHKAKRTPDNGQGVLLY